MNRRIAKKVLNRDGFHWAWYRNHIVNAIVGKVFEYSKKKRFMIQDLTISYVCSGIKTTFTIKDDHYDYDNMPYNLADMFEKVIRGSDANPQTIIDYLKCAFEYE